MQASVADKLEQIREEKKLRADVVAGLRRSVSVAGSIRAQQTALTASLREHGRITTDEVQTLEYKLYHYLQTHLNVKQQQVRFIRCVVACVASTQQINLSLGPLVFPVSLNSSPNDVWWF